MQLPRSFKLLWSSLLISQIGDWLFKIALPLLVFQKTGSASQMAAIYGVSFLPWLFFSLLGGLLADRTNKKNIMVLKRTPKFGHQIQTWGFCYGQI